jgi:signal transduction histidine kinase
MDPNPSPPLDALEKANPEIAHWSQRYQTALRRHLGQGPKSSLQPALALGRQAAALGLETLDVARVHEEALKALVLPNGAPRTRHRILARTRNFFEEAIVPIEQTHAAAKEDVRQVEQLGEKLLARTAESSASARRLKRGVVRRKAVETALGKSDVRHARLVEKSRSLEGRLQAQMRQILAAQEEERKSSSRNLQNEIAQILVAIHVRLLTLKEAVKGNTESLKKEIAETQALVKQSVQTIHRLANESGVHHEA